MKVKIFTIYTEAFKEVLSNYWSKTLPNDFDDVNIIYLEGNEAHIRTSNPKFRKMVMRKISIIKENVKNNINDIVIFADVDIYFFKSFRTDIIELMRDKEILFQRDGHRINDRWDYNCGFIAMKCTPNLLSFWEEVEKIYHKGGYQHEQQLINSRINNMNVKHGYLSDNYWANKASYNPDGRYGYSINDVFNAIPTNAFLFHACAMDGSKIDFLEKIENIYKEKKDE